MHLRAILVKLVPVINIVRITHAAAESTESCMQANPK